MCYIWFKLCIVYKWKYLTFQQLNKKTSLSPKNFIKDKMTAQEGSSGRIFKKISKKVKLKSQDSKKHIFKKLFVQFTKKKSYPVTSFPIFFHFFQKCAENIDHSCHFVFYENLCSSAFFGRTSPRRCSRYSPGGWIKISFLTKHVDI